MRVHFHPLGAAIIFTVLTMGVIGVAVILPIACIQWAWNTLVPNVSLLPPIGAWQAILLYVAAATILCLTGIVRVEFEAERTE